MDGVLTVLLAQALVRALAIAPLVVNGLTGNKIPAWIAWAAAAAIYITLVMPLRCWGGEKFRRMFYSRHMPDKNESPYGKWLKAELLRYAHGLLWGLPFLVWLGYCIHYYTTNRALEEINGFNAMWQPVMNLAVLLGQEPDMVLGLIVVFLSLLLPGALFAYGWWRMEMLEYLPLRSMELDRCFRWAGRMRRHHRGELIRNTLVNILLALPALIGFLLVLAYSVTDQIDLSRGSMYFLLKFPGALFGFLDSVFALRNPFSAKHTLMLAAVFVIFYLPLCTFRKLRNAALAARLMKGHSSSGEHHHHHGERKGQAQRDQQEAGQTEANARPEEAAQPDHHAAG